MEKLNISIFKSLLVVAVVAISSSVVAGPSYRMNAKAPVIAPAPKLGYVFGYGGYSFGSSYNNRGSFNDPWVPAGFAGDPFNIPINFSTDGGWTAGGGFGLYSSCLGGSRVELEASYLSNDSTGTVWNNIALPGTLRFQTNTAMVNFLKEFPVGQRLVGYTGFGFGYASTKLVGDTAGVRYSSRNDGFAWQYILGMDIPISQSVALFTQYRYLVLPDGSFVTDFGDFDQHVTDHSNHSVLFGARVSF